MIELNQLFANHPRLKSLNRMLENRKEEMD
jgi:hypothetical protein